MVSIRCMLAILLGCSFYSGYCSADSSPEPPADTFYLAIKGGISLGNYETGLNWMLLKYFQQAEQENKPENSGLVSFSGASAGSLNSILSAIDTCLQDPGESLENNLMRSTWDIGIDKLLPRKIAESSNLDENSGILSRAGFIEKIEAITRRIEQPASKDCNILITMSITKFEPYEHHIKGLDETINLQRFVIPVLVTAKQDETIVFRNLDSRNSIGNTMDYTYQDATDTENRIPGPYLKLVESRNPDSGVYSIDFKSVFSLALASSAFPVAFSPVEISYCFPHHLKSDQPCTMGRAETALFSDGGLFDNSPIGVSLDIENSAQCWRRLPGEGESCTEKNKTLSSSNILYIDPDSYRSKNVGPEKSHPSKAKTGLWDYGKYFPDSFGTASEWEYRSALERVFRDPNNEAHFFIANRYHHLLADFHGHFGAFYAKEFREHDYMVGIYDGAYAVSRLECSHQQSESGRVENRYCIQEKLLEKVQGIASDPRYQASTKGFFRYLFNTEFNKSLAVNEPDKNLSIVLAKAFGSTNKTNAPGISYKEYLENLRQNIADESIEPGSDFEKIVKSGPNFTAQKLRRIYSNLKNIQQASGNCTECKSRDINQSIGKYLDMAEPVALSAIGRYENGIWPLAVNDVFSLRYGFDIAEKSQVTSLNFRKKVGSEYSLDGSLSVHYFGSELESDHYLSAGLGYTLHFEGMSMPTLSLGFERGFEGEEIYKKRLDSVYLGLGILNEIVSFKLIRRIDDIERFLPKTRDETSFIVSVDVTKLYKIIF